VIAMAQKQPQLPEFTERYIALEKQLLEGEAAKLVQLRSSCSERSGISKLPPTYTVGFPRLV
jgi:hypothetical protein